MLFFPFRMLWQFIAMLTGMRLKKELLPPAPPTIHIPIKCREPELADELIPLLPAPRTEEIPKDLLK